MSNPVIPIVVSTTTAATSTALRSSSIGDSSVGVVLLTIAIVCVSLLAYALIARNPRRLVDQAVRPGRQRGTGDAVLACVPRRTRVHRAGALGAA